MKKIFFFLNIFGIIIFLNSCGYSPIYSSTNLNLKINQIEYKKNILNNQIARSLRLFSNPKSLKNYDIEFDTKTERRIVSKNSKGTPEVYEIKIILNLDIFGDNKDYSRKFTDILKYRNNENKFELKQYEKEIEKQITNELIEQILVYFSDL